MVALRLWTVLDRWRYWIGDGTGSVTVLDRRGLCESFPVVFYSTQYLSPLMVLAFTVERYALRSFRLYGLSFSTNCPSTCAYSWVTARERKCAENYNKWRNKFIFLTAISILVISKHNSSRVLFDKIASVYFIFLNIYLNFSIRNSQPREPALCQLYRHTFVSYDFSSPGI